MGQAHLLCSHAAPVLGPGCAAGCNHAARFDLIPALILLQFTWCSLHPLVLWHPQHTEATVQFASREKTLLSLRLKPDNQLAH